MGNNTKCSILLEKCKCSKAVVIHNEYGANMSKALFFFGVGKSLADARTAADHLSEILQQIWQQQYKKLQYLVWNGFPEWSTSCT